MVSGRNVDKFGGERIDPREKRFGGRAVCEGIPLIVECRLVHTFELGLHTQFVGEIMDVKAEESVMGKGRMADIRKVRPLSFAPDTPGLLRDGQFQSAKRSPSVKSPVEKLPTPA